MKKNRRTLLQNLMTYGLVILAYVLVQVCLKNKLSWPDFMGGGKIVTKVLQGQLVPICCWIVMAVSLNLVVGVSGELSLGHAGFMSVGAFSGIVASAWLQQGLQVADPMIRLTAAIIIGGIAAGILGVLIGIPVLRLRGDYLAIVTLAFGEIIRNVLNCVYVSVEGNGINFGFLNPNLAGTMVLKGPNGATGTKIATFEAGFVLVLIALIVVLNLVNSRSGRAIQAIRDNRIAAEAMGINVTKYKMMAFVTAAVLAGMAGALFGLNFSTITAAKFKFDQSINVLVFVVLGGIGNITGSVIAATVLTVLPEMLRSFSTYRMLIYAVVLILVMLATNSPAVKNVINVLTARIRGGEQKAGEPQ